MLCSSVKKCKVTIYSPKEINHTPQIEMTAILCHLQFGVPLLSGQYSGCQFWMLVGLLAATTSVRRLQSNTLLFQTEKVWLPVSSMGRWGNKKIPEKTPSGYVNISKDKWADPPISIIYKPRSALISRATTDLARVITQN